MHNRIKDVKSNSDDNGDVVEGKSTDKACLDGIDTRKYANFLTLFNSLKKRNASSLDIDHIQHLASVQQGRYQLLFIILTESKSFQFFNLSLKFSWL